MSRPALTLAVMGVWLCVWAGPERGLAHPLNPALLELWESREAAVEVLWRVPLSQPTNALIQPVLPDGCREISTPHFNQTEQSLTARWRLDCGVHSLVGVRIGVQGLYERKTDALVRIHLADGRLIQAVLRGDSAYLTVPERAGPLAVVRDYLELGFEHILTGLDHLLFVFGLVLLVHGRRRLLWTITAFTAGHSVTLSLAVLGVVRVPPAPVEALIAFSIFVVGVDLTREARGRALWTGRFPWAMAMAFGLLHGLGFAGALAQVGLPADEIPLALFSFNVGIEVGQLLFVGLVLSARVALGMLPVSWPQSSALIPAYAIGSLAAFWVFERAWGVLF
jgi:hydrogenase/urease accessory protein HupE